MTQEKPESDPEITDLDTARLALRGALQSVHNLQDLNARLKGDLHDYLGREKALNERMIRLQTELNESYSRLDQDKAAVREREAGLRETLRQEVISEQQHKWQAEIDTLRISVQNWAEVRREKETELRLLKEALLQKESDVFQLQKEKIIQEERAHREMLDLITKGRSELERTLIDSLRPKDQEISGLKKQLDEQAKANEIRLEGLIEEFRQKEQVLLNDSHQRQDALETEMARRERELWDKTQRERQVVEDQLKTAWNERLRTLERDHDTRRMTLDDQWRTKEKELQERWASREAALLRQWTEKEATLARQWLDKEKQLGVDFQQTLDEERQRASEEMARVKADTEAYRVALEQQLHAKEIELGGRQQTAEETLRTAWRHREEELLAKHQEAADRAQKAMADIQARFYEKEGTLKAIQDKLSAVQKDRDNLSDKIKRFETESIHRISSLEEQVRSRDQQLRASTADFTARDEQREGKLEALGREAVQRESELKVLKEQIQHIEADRNASIDRAAALQADFEKRRQELESAARREITQLREQLTGLAQGSTEREQVYERRITEFETLFLQKDSQLQGLNEQLALDRRAIEELTQTATARETDFRQKQKALEDRLVAREQELQAQLLQLKEGGEQREGGLQIRLTELENDLAQRISDNKSLEAHLQQTDEHRIQVEEKLGAMRAQWIEARKDARALQERLDAERAAAEKHLEMRLRTQEDAFSARWSTAEREHAKAESELQKRIVDLEKQLSRTTLESEDLSRRLAIAQETYLVLQQLTMGFEQTLDTERKQTRENDKKIQIRTAEAERAYAELQAQQRQVELERLGLQENLARLAKERQELEVSSGTREKTQQERIQSLEGSLQLQQTEWQSQLDAAKRDHLAAQEAHQRHIAELDQHLAQASSDLRITQENLIRTQQDYKAATEGAGAREKTQQERIQSLEGHLQAEQTEWQGQLEAAQRDHLAAQEGHQRRIAELERHLAQASSDLKITQENLSKAQQDYKVATESAGAHETALRDQLHSIEEHLKTQKEQMGAKLASVEREHLQNEENLQRRVLDIEEQLARKISTAKSLSDRLTHLEEEKTNLEKKAVSLDERLGRTHQQLKTKEEELDTALANAQKEKAQLQEAQHRRLQEIQLQKERLEQALKDLQGIYSQAQARLKQSQEEFKIREAGLAKQIEELEKQFKAQEADWTIKVRAMEKARQEHETIFNRQILDLEKAGAQKTAETEMLQAQRQQTVKEHQAAIEAATAEQTRLTARVTFLEQRLRTQKDELDARIQDLQGQRLTSEEALHRQIRSLQEELAQKALMIAALQENVQQAETSRALLEKNVVGTAGAAAKEQEALQARLGETRQRLRALESEWNHQVVELTDLRKALKMAEEERLALVGRLQIEKDKFSQDLSAQEAASQERVNQMESQLASVEKELRGQLSGSTQAYEEKIRFLQERVLTLEKQLAERKTTIQQVQHEFQQAQQEKKQLDKLLSEREHDLEQFRDAEYQYLQERDSHQQHKMEMEGLLAERESQLKGFEDQIVRMDKEGQQALEAEQTEKARWKTQAQALEKQFDAFKAESEKRLGQLQNQNFQTEESWHLRVSALQGDLDKKAALIRTLEEKIRQIESARATLEKERSEEHGQDVRQKQELEARLTQTNARAQEAITRALELASQLKDLQEALVLAQKDRQSLSDALAVQRDQYLAELASRENLSLDRQKTLEQQIDRLNKEMESRTASLTQESTQRLQALQARAVELEHTLGEKESDIHDLQDRLHGLEQEKIRIEAVSAERDKALSQLQAVEKQLRQSQSVLQQRAHELEGQVDRSRADRETLLARLADLEKRRDLLEKSAAEGSTDSARQRVALETQLAQDRAAFKQLERQWIQQSGQVKDLQSSLVAAEQAHQALLSELDQQKERFMAELAARDTDAGDMKENLKQEMARAEQNWRQRVAALTQESTQRLQVLQSRAAELEKQLGERDSEMRVLHDRLEASDEERQRLIVVDQAREKAYAELKAAEKVWLENQGLLKSRLENLEHLLSRKESELKAMHIEWTESEQVRKSLQKAVAEGSAEAAKKRDLLESQLIAEQDRVKQHEKQVAQHQTALKELQAAMAAVKLERQNLLDELAAQREKFQVELSGRENLSIERQGALKEELAQAEQIWRLRMTALTQESAQRLGILQVRAADLEKQLGQRDSEMRVLHDRLEASDEDRQRLIAVDQAREKAYVELKAAEKAWLEREGMLKSQLETLEHLLSRKESEYKGFGVQQAAQVKELQAALAAAQQEHQTLLAVMAQQKEKHLAELAARENQSIDRQNDLKEELARIEKDTRIRLAAATKESSQRLEALQVRATELEKQLGQRDSEVRALQDKLETADEERQRLQASEAGLQAALQQIKAVEKQLVESQDALGLRAKDLEDQLSRRGAELSHLQNQLEKAEQAKANLEKHVADGSADASRLRVEFEARIGEERVRVRQQEKSMAQQAIQLKDLERSLVALEKDRKDLLVTLAAQKDKFLEEISSKETDSSQRQHQLNKELERVEKEWRLRVAGLTAQSAQQLETIQNRAIELEHELTQRQMQVETLTDRIDELSADRERLTIVDQAREKAFTELKAAEQAWLENQEGLKARLTSLEDRLTRKESEYRGLQTQLAESEKRKESLEKAMTENGTESLRHRATLEGHLAEERRRAQQLEKQVARHVSDLKELQAALVAAEQSHQALASEINQQKEHFTAELNAREADAGDMKENLKQEVSRVEQSWRLRVTALTQESSQRLEALQLRAAELEKQLGQRDSEVRVLHDRLEASDEDRQRLIAVDQAREKAYAELKAAEKVWLEHQGMLKSQLQTLEHLLSRKESEYKGSELQQAAQVKELQSALAAAQQERQALLAEFSVQKEKWLTEIASKESDSAQLKQELKTETERMSAEWRKRVAGISADSARQLEGMQKRAVELERHLVERDAQIRDVEDSFQQMKAERTRLETLGAEREKALQDIRGRFEQERKRMKDLEVRLADQSASAEHAQVLEKQVDALQKELRQRVAQLTQEAAQRMDGLQGASRELEQKLAEKDLEVEELSQRLRQVEEDRARLENLATEREKALEDVEAESRRAADIALIERKRLEKEADRAQNRLRAQAADLQARLNAIQEERQESESTLQRRLIDIQDQLTKKTGEAKSLADQLRQGVSSQAMAEKSTVEERAEGQRQRAALEERLAAERTRVRQLEAQLAEESRKLADLQEALTAVGQERKSLLESMTAQKEKFLNDLVAKENTSVERQRALEKQIASLESHLREGVEGFSKSSADRLQTLQRRALELERALGDKEGELMAVQEQVRQLEKDRQRLEGIVDERSGELAKREATMEQDLKRRGQELEKRAAGQEEALQKAWTQRQRETERQYAADLEKAQASFLGQMKVVREESEQALHRLQEEYVKREQELTGKTRSFLDQEADWSGRKESVEAQMKSAQAGLDEQRHALEMHEKKIQQRAEELAQRQAQLQSAEKGTDQLKDQLMAAIQTGSARGGNAPLMQSLMEEWVFGFAHQVRNPLGIIRSIAESLIESGAGRQAKNGLQAVLKAVDGLNERLNEFIEFSKPIRPFTKPVNLSEAIQRASGVIQPRLSKQGIELKISVSDRLPPLMIDADHLHTILVNLLVNALDAMPEGGRVEIRADYDSASQMLHVKVKDQGRGISPEHLKDIGKPFFTTKPGAVGLGMAISKRLLRAYEGDLQVESKAGHGTTVSCHLRAKPGEATAWAA